MILVPADFAQAQTSSCPTGETATSNSGLNSGTCVPNNQLDGANACETAGWSIAEETTAEWWCQIKIGYFDPDNFSPPFDDGFVEYHSCALGGSNGKILCSARFADTSSFPSVQVSMGVTLNSETDTRRFWSSCDGEKNPTGKNDAGQTQCCEPPTTDHDMNPDTACEAPAPVSACQNGGGCPTNSFCQEQQGGEAECVCNVNYRGGTSGGNAFAPDSGTTCEDTDECLTPILSCGAGATCTNTVGSYSCLPCQAGYRQTPGQPDTDPRCVDIDSCTEDSNYCNGNGQCRNFQGIVDQCDCGPGWGGDFCADRVVVTLNLSAGTGGALSAKTADDPDVEDGGEVPIRARVTFIATPDAGYYVSQWTGCGSPNANTGGHTDGGEKTCATAADKNPLEVSVAFADIDECQVTAKNNCHGGGTCENDVDNPGADPICKCGPGTTGDGVSCFQDRTVELRPGSGGTIVASDGDGEVGDGDVVPHRTTITFTARPDSGYYVSRWSLQGCGTAGVHFGSPSDTGEKSCEVVAGVNLAADRPVLASVTFGDINECDMNNGGCGEAGTCLNLPGSFRCSKCGPGLTGESCDEDLPKVEMVVPSGGVTLHATPEADCYVQGWTDSACADATGGSGETGSDGRKSCVSSGTGEVTVGVYFECGP